MHVQKLSEKQPDKILKATEESGRRLIVFLLHAVLWTSLYIIVSTLYTTATTLAMTETILFTFLVTGVTGLVSVLYVALHNAAALISRSAQTQPKTTARLRIQKLATISLQLSVLLWLISSGLSATFILARHPSCISVASMGPSNVGIGTNCAVERSTIGTSLLALLLSFVLFVAMYKVEDPFRAHLLGITKEQALLPLILPYKVSRQGPMFSEMSFKCRSSSSSSSHTLVPFHDSSTGLHPSKPETVFGLGIYEPKVSATFLGPRPSLSSIRTHTTIGTIPPSSPLPPLPTYFPERYRQGSAMHTAIYPPRRPAKPKRSKSERTVRVVPPSPALSITNLKLHNSSMESLSSVYSRSISGEKQCPREQRPTTLTDGSRSFSSGSTATIIKSPLGAMRLADQPEVVVLSRHSRVSSDSSVTEIDDVITLQAMLPSVKAVSDFGDGKAWNCQIGSRQVSHNGHNSPYRDEFKQRTWMPLRVRKARDSESLFQWSNIKALV